MILIIILALVPLCENTTLYSSASKGKDNEENPELPIIISLNKLEYAIEIYKKQWQIETAFSVLKTSGFNIEDTHLTEIEIIEKLFVLVLVAFKWAI